MIRTQSHRTIHTYTHTSQGTVRQQPAGLVGAARLCVAMHWVTDPGHSLPCPLNSLHQGWQLGPQLLLAHAYNDGQPARCVLRVEGVDHGDQVIGVHLVTDLDPNGVANATHELHMRCIQLASALATPQEVTCICNIHSCTDSYATCKIHFHSLMLLSVASIIALVIN